MNIHAPAAVRPLVDPFGRAIAYLRVSVTDRCDYRCVYCMSEDMNFLPKRDVLSLEELDRELFDRSFDDAEKARIA